MVLALCGFRIGSNELASRRNETKQASSRAISTLILDFRKKLRSRPRHHRAAIDDDEAELSHAQEIRWLKKRLHFDFPEDEADELVAILEHLPLPIDQLAKVQPGKPPKPDAILSTFLNNLRNEQTLIDLEPDQEGSQDSQSMITKAIISLIEISLIEVARLDPAANRLLCFMSVLRKKAIPRILLDNFRAKELVQRAVVVQPVSTKPIKTNRFQYLSSGRKRQVPIPINQPKTLEDSLNALLEYGLIAEDADGAGYSMNSLVQQAAINWIEARTRTTYWHRCVTDIFYRVFHGNKAEVLGNFPALIPHVRTVILDKPVPDSLYDTCDAGEDRNYLLTRVGVLNEFASECTEHGLLDLAQTAVSEATAINARLFPPHRSSALWTQSRYGHVLNANRNMADGKLAEAEARLRGAVESVDVESDERHALPAVLTSLGESLYQQAKFEEAHEIFLRAVKESEETVGETHCRTLNCLRNLAVNHIARHQFQDAEDLQHRVVKAKEKSLGLEHSETLLSKSDFGRVLQSNGKYTVAETMQRDVSSIFKATLGASHPWTLLSLYRLATALNLQGKNREALTINAFVLEERGKLYGNDAHQAMIATIKQHAFILLALKRYDECEKLFLRSKESHTMAFGPDHRRTASITAEYESMLKQKNDEFDEKTTQLDEKNSDLIEQEEQSDFSYNEKRAY